MLGLSACSKLSIVPNGKCWMTGNLPSTCGGGKKIGETWYYISHFFHAMAANTEATKGNAQREL